eukprot:TRINITY_DN8231_c0_g2_i1.p1 TRINITY_DN8231_c0_g2~~TRINITY_DN8231_c0_g2_i1.p1  ORF type:complete len:269 (+),score=28.48 TRINITY_DN8231_c0_g2_i1:14-820(+)
MAADYWSSSHCQYWMLTKEQINQSHSRDRPELKLTTEDVRRITNHFVNQIQGLAKKFTWNDQQQQKGLRQRVVATAIVYFRRFYFKYNFVEFCPKLTAPTCLYIASKVEECSSQAPAYRFEKEMKRIDASWPYNTSAILEAEFYVLEALQFNLIFFHPYKPLQDYVADCELDRDFLDTAWNVINDSYSTDTSLMFPPHIIALACMYLASYIHSDVDLRQWFAELSIDVKEIWAAASEITDYYESMKMEKKPPMQEILLKLPAFSRGDV